MPHETPMEWPRVEELVRAMSLPEGVTFRLLKEEELAPLPELLVRWYPAVRVGAESVFLDPDFLRRSVVREGCFDRDIYAILIVQHGEVVGFTTYERQPRSATLHGRLGMLAPQARAGFLGALAFLALEKMAALTKAELILVWITLASRHQQLFAERRGFQLVGVVPGFDRDQVTAQRSLRVTEGLVAKLLVPDSELLTPPPEALTPRTQRMLELIRKG